MSEITQQLIERIIEEEIIEEDMTPGDSPGGLRRHLRSALTAFAEEQEKWLPIETAPKDGTKVLLLIDREAIVGYWGSIDWPRGTGIEVPNSEMWRMTWENYGIGEPSHWMPLPPAPSTGEKPE